jgi:membrane protein implicated in regulation of membrane protease activity
MIIYAAIGAFGLIFLILMLLVGEFFGGDHQLGQGDVDHSGGTGILSIRVFAAFLTAFGAGGVVSQYYGLSHPASSGIGVVAGIVMGGLVYQFARLLYAQQASTDLNMRSLVGSAAVTSVAIPAGGVGQVSLSAAGELSEHLARSADGQPVARGTAVVIIELGGDAVIVRPAQPGTGGPQ